MLKSLITQFLATLILGPIGLLYSSLAAAVFLTLILAVLYFTELSFVAMLIIWPISILTGLVLVKLHNDDIRSSGSRLLLGPEGEEARVGTLASWARGVAVLTFIAVGGYFALSASSPKGVDLSGAAHDDIDVDADIINASASASASASGTVNDRDVVRDANIDDASVEAVLNNSSEELADTNSSDVTASPTGSESVDQQRISELPVAKTSPVDRDVQRDSNEDLADIDLPQVTFNVELLGGTTANTQSNLLYVNSELVNLREGPGAGFEILSTVKRGVELSEVERSGSWIQVIANDTGNTGWIFGRLVTSQRQ